MSISAPSSPPGRSRLKPRRGGTSGGNSSSNNTSTSSNNTNNSQSASTTKPQSRSCPTSPTNQPNDKVEEPKKLCSQSNDQSSLSNAQRANELSQPELPKSSFTSLSKDSRENIATFKSSPRFETGLAIRTKPLPPKRLRPRHDVDGPGTCELSCKKRRLRHSLVTSRLSQPFSQPASHIIVREHGRDDTPVLSRFLKLATTVNAKKAAHQPGLIRKAAILNRVRINVRLAAVSRGHVQMAGLTARQNVLHHGLQLVTAPGMMTGATLGTGARFFAAAGTRALGYDLSVPVTWRPHIPHPNPSIVPPPRENIRPGSPVRSHGLLVPPPFSLNGSQHPTFNHPAPKVIHNTHSGPAKSPPLPGIEPQDADLSVTPGRSLFAEEDDSAFPASDFLDDRYADYSDDDMDDVYADFGVLFGAPASPRANSEEAAPNHGGSSPNRGRDDDPSGSRIGSQSPGREHQHFYEEYLDELDGIPWAN